MVCKSVLLAFAAASAVLAAPTPAAVTDTDVLQFALTLEHLEAAFYKEALAKFDAAAFEKAGFADWVRGRFNQIGEHEAAHVKFLTGALGSAATQACEYDFGLTDPAAFAMTSMSLENVGDAAYIGAAQLVSDKGVLTDAASILSVEARHSSWISSAVRKEQGWNGPFDAPLTPSGAFSIASLFVKSCPSSNPALPVKTFPALTLSEAAPAHGAAVAATFTPAAGADTSAPRYVAWLNGLAVEFSDLDKDGKTTVPSDLEGTVFAAVVSSKSMPSDGNMLSGFTIAEFPFTSFA
ncbi:ferritin-like domain-containing protein [Lenzites betulinus]|nr:ferritin-like domain-containing protein [Lenzites betulinus]